MARATSGRTKSPGRPPSRRSAAAAKTQPSRTRGTAKTANTIASKEELRARVEKLERANATLRIKNKELRVIAVEAAEQVDALTVQLANSERRANRQARHEAPAETVATREIHRPARGRRRTRATEAGTQEHSEAEDGHDDESRLGWAASDHAEA